MKVLVACEFSGVVRRAFEERGHDAISCDLLPAEDGSYRHLQCDVHEVLLEGWDLMIAHPPCTHIARSGARWWKHKAVERLHALAFVQDLLNAPIPRIALENPVGSISTHIRHADQYVHPWQFGHPVTKKTGLWLKGLPLLKPTNIVEPERSGVMHVPERKDRWKIRSRTYPGIAAAMADQWGSL